MNEVKTIKWPDVSDWYSKHEQAIRDVMQFEGLKGATLTILQNAPAQSELAALREELAGANRSAETLHEVIGRLKSERDAAEQRNAVLTEALEDLLKGSGASPGANKRYAKARAALKSIEAGASE